MDKILIIGQAPAFVKQGVPYDSTMLYDWLKEVEINKEEAQELFDFEAVYNKFPGFDAKGGHLKPSNEQMMEHWMNTLETKVQLSNKIWVVGAVPKTFLDNVPKTWSCSTEWFYTIHPSKRNYSLYMRDKEIFIQKLKGFLNR